VASCARAGCQRWRPDFIVRLASAGVHFDGGWYCSTRCLEQSARRWLADARQARAGSIPALPPLKLGALLVHQGAVTPATLRRALDEQTRTKLPIGAQLLHMGAVSTTDVLRALAAQAGVSYLTSVDTASVQTSIANVSRDAARALGVVPIELDAKARHLKVACTAPIPRLALGALRELTGCTVEPLLVADDQWRILAAAYQGAAPAAASTSVAVAVRDIGDAAARIARAAEDGRADRMAHAWCEPYMWVRLEGGGHTEDLLLTVDGEPEGKETQRWPVAPTQH